MANKPQYTEVIKMKLKLSLILDALYPTIMYLCGMITVIASIFQPEFTKVTPYDPNAASINWINVFTAIMISAVAMMFISIFMSNKSIIAYSELWKTPEKLTKTFAIFTLVVIIIATFTDGIFMLFMLLFELPCFFMIQNWTILIDSIKFPVDAKDIYGKTRNEIKNLILNEYPEAEACLL